MTEPQPSGIKSRLTLYRAIIILTFLALIVQLWRLQTVQGDYYREAATYARNATPGFDPALLQQRINYLEQKLP